MLQIIELLEIELFDHLTVCKQVLFNWIIIVIQIDCFVSYQGIRWESLTPQ